MVARLLLAGALALALTGCDPGTDRAGGPVDPGLARVPLGPSLSPVDDAVRTGIVPHDQELVLFLIPGGDPWPPDRYPLISVYDSSGTLIVSARLRDVATELKGG